MGDISVDWVNAGISGVAAAIALVALVVSWCNSRRIVEIEESRDKASAKEMKRAKVRVSFEKALNQGLPVGVRLRVENVGPAEARAVSVSLGGQPIRIHKARALVPVGSLAIPLIGPGAYVDYLLQDWYEGNEEVEVTWVDDSGDPGRFRNWVARNW